MAATFYTILTKAGQASVANATALNQPVNLTKMAVGDGGGAAVTPKETQTALVGEKFRANLNSLIIDPSNANYIVAEMIIPTTTGGWSVREVGIFDSAGNLFAVANFPETYKPQLSEGSGRDLVVRIVIQVSNASAVTLQVDPAVTLASQSWVISNYVNKSKLSGGKSGQVLAKNTDTEQDYGWKDPNTLIADATTAVKGLVQLTNATDSTSEKLAVTAKALTAAGFGRLIGPPKVFLQSSLYTPTAGTKNILIEAIGGGGAGAGAGSTSSTSYSAGGSGTAGAYGMSFLNIAANNITTVPVTVGTGGTGGNGAPSNGSNGGESRFGDFIVAGGGYGAITQAPRADGFTITGTYGGSCVGGNVINMNGGSSGAVICTGGLIVIPAGGSSFYGVGGNGYANWNVNGKNGTNNGAGGSGASSHDSPSAYYSGGNGANGLVMVWEFA